MADDIRSSLSVNRQPFNRADPLQIYLDSSDYSVLSAAASDESHPFHDIFDQLCEWIDNRAIEIRFTGVHVLEITHVDQYAKPFAKSRAQCLQRLCRGKCFRFWSELPSIECSNLIAGRPVGYGVKSDSGEWHPDTGDPVRIMKDTFIDEFNNSMRAQSVNRKGRRSLQKRFLKNGHLSAEAVKMLRAQDRTSILAEIAENFPVSERFIQEDLMLRYAAGQTDAREIAQELSSILRDIEIFVNWTADKYRDSGVIVWLRSFGSNLIKAASRGRDSLSSFVIQHGINEDQRRQLKSALDEQVSELRRRQLRDIVETVCPRGEQAQQLHALASSPLGTIPSLDALLICMADYFRRNAQTDRSLLSSDGGDVLHLAYLPYCDLFRSDGETAQVARQCADLFGVRIVPKLRQLPDQISSALRQRKDGS